jgi:hypothetical protein
MHVGICTACDPPTFTRLASQDNISMWVRDHRRKHLAQLRNRASTITLLFDSEDETDPWLGALLNWRANFYGDSESTEGPEVDST